MATPTIIRGSEHFFTFTYEGNGGGQRVGKFVPFTDNGTIAKSLIINDGDNAFLSRTNDSGDRTRATVSFWVKRAHLSGNINYIFTSYDGSSTNDAYIRFNTNNTIATRIGTGSSHLYVTNRTFEDTSKWYHIVLAVNTNDSTADDRVKLYVDGDRITSFSSQTNPSQGDTTQFNYSSATFRIGSTTGGAYDFDGYLAEFNYIDGTTYDPSTFGLTDTSTGRWIPKSLTGITYGTNGHRLEFANSAGQTIGDDTSGNTNDFSVTNLVAGDITTDSPTQNHATLSSHSLYKSSNFTISEGNLKATSTSVSGTHSSQGGMRIPSGGKYYWECEIDSGKDGMAIGIIPTDTPTTSVNPSTATLYLSSGAIRTTGSDSLSYGSGVNNGDIIGFALDLSDKDNGKLYVSVNGTYENSGNPVTGANPAPSKALIGDFRVIYQDGSNGYTPVYIFNFGQKTFNTAPPTGYSSLQQDNFPTTEKGMSDFVWIKNRDASDGHQLYDSTRGPLLDLQSDATSAEGTTADGLQKFLKGGFSIEDDVSVNTSGESYVSWNWVANGGTTSANTDGSGATIASTIQANQTAGFSIVRYDGDGGNAARKVAHGLSQAPEWILLKFLDASSAWSVYHTSLGNGKRLKLDASDAPATATSYWNDTSPTSSVFTVGSDFNQSTAYDYVAYCWHSVEGFSKFGSYLGNAGSNGPLILTGFKPAWVMIKRITSTGEWFILDKKRNPINTGTKEYLDADTTDSKGSLEDGAIDWLSNGFKIRQSSSQINNGAHIYMAFAEHPFLGDGTNPCTAV